MDRKELIAGPVVPGCAESIAADQDALLFPPKRDLVPTTARADVAEREGPERLPRDQMVGDTESIREQRAVAIVTIEQLDDTGRGTGCANPLLDSVAVNRVDGPDSAVG